jgi:ubiquinone/menaquinone biosynthesis C-methylase UbiE
MNILEIGCGNYPAINSGGELFTSNTVNYVAADIPSWYVSQDVDPEQKPKTPFVFANAAHLPFRDETFDYILMKSVFGQFEDKETVSDLDDIRTWGMMEVYRTLRPGGHFVVAEEVTPWEDSYIESYMQDIGLEPIAYEKQSSQPNPAWTRLRRRFFGEQQFPNMGAYVLIGEKPTNTSTSSKKADIYFFPRPGMTTKTATVWSGKTYPLLKDKPLIATKTYQLGMPISKPSIIRTS